MVTMVNERDDNVNRPAQRGRKLRNQGSKPTGSQTMSFTPEYSGEMDYATGSMPLNKNVRMSKDNYTQGDETSECCKKLGLNLKEPLS
ncbi:MAG: hypothetical protein OEN02_03160 [Gammaproteobacteria bacterium]|nr:hypothetical protein [Gammaproteobacteria bacterium]MDH3467816.1 hypothetical protein [Gammaproteobacteria bacterium]